MKKVVIFAVIAMFALSGCSLKTKEEAKKIINTNTAAPAADENVADTSNQDTTGAAEQPTVAKPTVLIKDIAAVIVKTNFGDITFGFYIDDAPNTITNFVNLAAMGYYNDIKFHRVIKGFMVQSGDPNSKDDDWSNDGMGGPGYSFADEINKHLLVRGSLAMANSGANTNGSQFFVITASSTPWLDGAHTNFGYVAAGMDIVDKIENVAVNENDHPTEDVIITGMQVVLTEEGQKKFEEQQKQAAAAAQQSAGENTAPATSGPAENPQTNNTNTDGETVNPQGVE